MVVWGEARERATMAHAGTREVAGTVIVVRAVQEEVAAAGTAAAAVAGADVTAVAGADVTAVAGDVAIAVGVVVAAGTGRSKI
jgi:hypothetical protein